MSENKRTFSEPQTNELIFWRKGDQKWVEFLKPLKK
jgi:hypothetical protein